jgi:hypothetical protein
MRLKNVMILIVRRMMIGTVVKRRGFQGRRGAILVDCTTCSPLAKDVKDYKPGKTADAGTKRKIKEY